MFPDSMTPLAIGRERSIRLVDDIVGADRELALVTVRSSEAEEPGLGRPVRDRHGGERPQADPVPDGTSASSSRESDAIVERRATEPYLIGDFEDVPDILPDTPEVEALTRNVQGLFARSSASSPTSPKRAAAGRHERRRPERAVPPRRLDAPDQDRREAGAARAGERGGTAARVAAILNRELEVFELGSRIQSQVQPEMEKGSASISCASS